MVEAVVKLASAIAVDLEFCDSSLPSNLPCLLNIAPPDSLS